MLYKDCGHYTNNGDCPCIKCPDGKYRGCKGTCINQSLPIGYEVDTSLLCPKARAYCESGRKDNENV